MEVVIFEDKKWNEIPEQDNPAFDYVYEDDRLKKGFNCLMISKVLPYEEKSVGKDGYVVIEVPIHGDVIRRGLFWNLNDAKAFTGALAKTEA